MAYSGLAVGDFASGALSQVLKSRKRVLFAFIPANALAIIAYFTLGATSVTAFYACVFMLGVANGYWAIFVTVASEQFGTNLRATAATTAPNFVRGALVPMNMAFLALGPSYGPVGAAVIIGAVVALIAFLAVFALEETFGKDLDYVEH
jgi:fucose permease